MAAASAAAAAAVADAPGASAAAGASAGAAQAAVFGIVFLLPSGGTVGFRRLAAGSRDTVTDVVKGLAAGEGVDAAGVELFALPAWPVVGDKPTADAITAAIAGAGVPATAPVRTVSHTHYYAARLHAPPPPSAAAKGGGTGGGAGAAIIAGMYNALCCGA